jgi:hypothetical protein
MSRRFLELWSKYLSQQSGFININNVVSTDPEIEKKIIEEGTGYRTYLKKIERLS